MTVNGFTFTAEAGIPVTIPWKIIDKKSGAESEFEAESVFFTVPAGEYVYKTAFKSSANKRVRISACGTKAFALRLNGEKVWEHDGVHYVPAFHRDDAWFEAELREGRNEIELDFADSREGEVFLGFGTLWGCTQWDDSMEYLK